MAKVYRFENTFGDGMYSHYPAGKSLSSFGLATGEGSFSTDRWPMVYDDIKFYEDSVRKRGRDKIRYTKHDKFGFSSIAQMKRWVYKKAWRKALGNHEMNLCVYEVPSEHVIIGSAQCTFDSRYAELIEILPTDHFG